MADDDPAAAASAASGGEPIGPDPDPDPDPDGSGGGDPDGGGGGRSARSRIVGALLETEPDEAPEDYPEVEPHVAHALIGVKKVVNHLTGGELREGTPAIENFARAAIGWADALPEAEGEGGDGEW